MSASQTRPSLSLLTAAVVAFAPALFCATLFGATLPVSTLLQQGGQQAPFGVDVRWDEDLRAVVVTNVVADSDADRAGLQRGDMIVGGTDGRGEGVDIQLGGFDAFGGLVSQSAFKLHVYRNRNAERPIELSVRRGQANSTSRRTGPEPRRPGGTNRPATLVFEKRTFQDPEFGIDSHTLLVPKGWKAEFRVMWTPTNTIAQHTAGEITGPMRQQAVFCPSLSFTFSQEHYYRQALQRQGPQAMKFFRQPPQRVGEGALIGYLGTVRPNARNVRVVEARRLPDVEKAFAQMSGRPNDNMNNGMREILTAEVAETSYEEDGQTWTEVVIYLQQVFVLPGLMNGPPTINWSLLSPRSVRAPREHFQQEAGGLVTITSSLRELPRWSICRSQLVSQIMAIKHKGHMDRMGALRDSAAAIAKNNESISDSQMASWRRQQAMKDEGHRKTVNGINEVHDYKSRDGFSLALTHNYSRVFQDPLGNIIMTNDTSYDPAGDMSLKTNDWKSLERIR